MRKKIFRNVPVGGRISEYGKVWVVIENYGDGLIVEYTGEKTLTYTVCSFVDDNNGITLDSEVNFID